MRVKEGNKEKDIIEASIKVFAEYGYHNSKISKIAEVAGVATGSVYVYYKNKKDILQKIFSNLWSNINNEIDNIIDNSNISSLEKLDAMIDLIFDMFAESPALAKVFVNEQINIERTNENEVLDYYSRFLDKGRIIVRKGIEEGVISKNFDLDVFREFIFGAIRHLVHSWAKDPKSFPINKTRLNVKYLIKNGIKD